MRMGYENQDFILWKKFKNGDSGAFDQIYDRYIDALYAFGSSYLKDRELIKDCIHDLFFELYKYRRNLSDTDNIKFYLFKSLKKKIVKQNKHRLIMKYQERIPDHLLSMSVSEEETIVPAETEEIRLPAYLADRPDGEKVQQKLVNAINNLSDRQREGLFLKFRNELPYKEIANIMDISVNSARTLIYRSIKTLRKAMDTLNP